VPLPPAFPSSWPPQTVQLTITNKSITIQNTYRWTAEETFRSRQSQQNGFQSGRGLKSSNIKQGLTRSQKLNRFTIYTYRRLHFHSPYLKKNENKTIPKMIVRPKWW